MDMFHLLRDHRRKSIIRKSFPHEWSRMIDCNIPWCRFLIPEERNRLENLIKVFIREKNFEGCGGIEINDEIKVTISAQACLLLLNLRHNYYERLVSILVYPWSINYEKEEYGPDGIVSVSESEVLGLSSTNGAIVLSWPDTLKGAQSPGDGINIVFHEFAHQLDQLDGVMDGTPPLDSRRMYREWAHFLGEEYIRLQRDVEMGTPSLISAYGATQPAEFFAVVTEIFFEKPLELQREHPALYEEFRKYYRQDPAVRSWKTRLASHDDNTLL